uniref:Uncharacterized protein n=1 Tax=Pelusios castaneus TaxID=367368 RepID=A0A8C8VFN2_9SAUR
MVALTKKSERAPAKRAEEGLTKVALAEGVLVKGAEGGLAKEPKGVPAEQDMPKGALAKGDLDKEPERVPAKQDVSKGIPTKGGLAKEPEGTPAEQAVPKRALAKESLAKGVEGDLAKEPEGVPAKWDVPEGALAEGGLAKEHEGVLAKRDVPKGGCRLLQHDQQASGPIEQEKAVPVDSQREKVDLYLPDRLPNTAGSWAEAPQQGEVGSAGLPGEVVSWDKLLALYQVLVALKQRHGPNSQAWREQFHRLAELYGLQWPLSRALIHQLGAADQHGSQSIPANAMWEAQEQREVALGQRILYQVLQRAPRKLPKPPAFCGVIPLNYQNNVHVLQPLGEAHYGAMALAWRTVRQDGQGQLGGTNRTPHLWILVPWP